MAGRAHVVLTTSRRSRPIPRIARIARIIATSLILAAVALAVWATVAESATIHSHYATSYCLQGIMKNEKYVHRRAVAHNFLMPGTKIRLVGKSFYGIRRFVVSDTGPALSDGHFDLWSPSCSRSIAWGKRTIRYKIGWGKP